MAVKTNEILIGSKETPFLTLDNDNIISINGNLACDLLCEEIPIDTLEIQCRYDLLNRQFAPSDYDGVVSADGKALYVRDLYAEGSLQIPYATPVWYYNGGSYIGKFYVTDARRTGKTVFVIKVQSAMGVLDGMTYYGNLLINQPLLAVIKKVILTDGMENTETPFLLELADSIAIGPGLDSVTVTGWIPVCTKREALHHVLFAQGVNILKSENDSFLITRISNASVGRIDPNNEYDNGSVDLTERVKSVEVTEHYYVRSPNAEPVVLYDNTENPVDLGTTVVFDSAPIVAASLTATGTLEILASNENCAIVSGVGTLTGIPYTHTTNVISRINGSNADGQTISVSDATLINTVNSNAVADRLYRYYSTKRDMQIPIVLSGEKCGMKYTCTNPFGEEKEAFIASMSINASAIAKADCKLVSGYEHPEKPGELTNLVVLTGNGVWKVPDEVLESDNPRIRVVLIGGGQGGQSGQAGQTGKEGAVISENQLAQPGNPGTNGDPGRIRMVQIDTNLAAEYVYSCGNGGTGGKCTSSNEYGHNEGEHGEPTVFGDYSSAVGTIPEVGFIDPLSGDVYGGPSPDFSQIMRSGRGGGAVKYSDPDTTYAPDAYGIEAESGVIVVNDSIAAEYGLTPGSILEVRGGRGGVSGFSGVWTGIDGGGGGGPALGYINTHYDNFCDNGHYYQNNQTKVISGLWGGKGGDGPDGPNPFVFSKTAYGRGGIGGHGGGGGGSSGYTYWYDTSYTLNPPNPSSGGLGGAGSDGAPGCILVYY